MARNDKQPAPERNQTDTSLRNEREKTDQELGKSGTRIEKGADAVVEHARERVDETLKAARAKARAKLDRAGATPEARASAKAEQVTEEASLTAERRAADVQLEKEREERRRAIARLLRLERGQTDKHLMLERARSDEELDHILAELADAVRIREEFLSLASHQLKTPLTPLGLSLQSLAREAAKQPDSSFAQNVNGYIDTANRQVRKLSALVAELLDVSRMAPDKLRLVLEPVDLGTVVRDVAARYRPRAERASCVLDVEAPGVTGRWDKLRLEQVVTNLIENAITFGPGKPIRIRLQATSEKARLTVRDEGIGIAPSHRSRIFERFERAVSSRNHGGFGLGLYICRTIVEALDGTISVQSEPGRGSTFTVELPLSGPRDAVDPPDTAKPAPPE
jgi:signal transduction histidine kinase